MVELLNDGREGGMNLPEIERWMRLIPRTNILFSAQPWISTETGWDDGGTWNSDADGHPQDYTQHSKGGAGELTTLLLNGAKDMAPAGTYVLKHEGTADIRASKSGDTGGWVNGSTGRVEITVSWATQDEISLEVRNYSSDFRLTAIYLPGYEDDDRWHPDFLAALAPFGWLRMMDWQQTNNSAVSNEADVRPRTYWTQAGDPTEAGGSDAGNVYQRGVAWEWMVGLCNEAGKDLWVCIPHQATDAYVSALARYVEQNLNADLRVYVEYSNECWNGIFDQNDYCETAGTARGLDFDDLFRGGERFYAERSKEVHDLFRAAFLADERHRVVRVRATQNTVEWRSLLTMDWDKDIQDELPVNAGRDFDVYATAPYFGNTLDHPGDVADVAETLTALDSDSASRQSTHTSRNAGHALARGLDFWTYEGGQHLVGNNDTETQLWVDANRDAGIQTVYEDDLARWRANGGRRYTFFTLANRYEDATGDPQDPWGILENQGDHDPSPPPKWVAISNYLDSVENMTSLLENTSAYTPASGGGGAPWTALNSTQFTIPVLDRAGTPRDVGGVYMVPSASGVYPPIYYCRGGRTGSNGNLEDAHLLFLADRCDDDLSTSIHGAPEGFCAIAVDYFGGNSAWNGRTPTGPSGGTDEFGGQEVATVLAMQAAFQELAKVDPSLATLVGTSRGGMMACLALMQGFRAHLVVLVNPLLDLSASHYRANRDLESDLRANIPGYDGTNPGALRSRDIMLQLDRLPTEPRYVLIQGTRDTTVRPTTSRAFVERMRERGAVVDYYPVEQADHSFQGPASEDYTEVRDAVFQKVLVGHNLRQPVTTVATAVP